MRTIKVYSDEYYNSGTTLASLGLQDPRWKTHSDDESEFANLKQNDQNAHTPGWEPDTFRYILNSVGLDCDYTYNKTDTHSLRIIDIGSYHNWEILAIKASVFFNGLPFILYSSQEPCVEVASICNQVPNCYIMDMSYGIPLHERHIPFPSFFTRLINNFFNVNINYHTINIKHDFYKSFIFNNLKFRSDAIKTITQFFLTHCEGILDKGIVTYSRDKGHISSLAMTDKKWDEFRRGYKNTFQDRTKMDILKNYNGNVNIDIDSLLSEECFNNFLSRVNDITLNNWALNYQGDTPFNNRRRYHPIWVYNKSYFSMITESTSANGVVCFSEKSIYPIMMGHPFIIDSKQQGLFYRSLTDLGFELFDEILEYPEYPINDHDHEMSALINCVNNIQNFNVSGYKRNIESITKKSAHNRSNMLNTHSTLWKKLRKIMLENLEKYFDACSNYGK